MKLTVKKLRVMIAWCDARGDRPEVAAGLRRKLADLEQRNQRAARNRALGAAAAQFLRQN